MKLLMSHEEEYINTRQSKVKRFQKGLAVEVCVGGIGLNIQESFTWASYRRANQHRKSTNHLIEPEIDEGRHSWRLKWA